LSAGFRHLSREAARGEVSCFASSTAYRSPTPSGQVLHRLRTRPGTAGRRSPGATSAPNRLICMSPCPRSAQFPAARNRQGAECL